jgi:hypothetical protein
MNTTGQKSPTIIGKLIVALNKMSPVQFDVIVLIILAVASAGMVLVVNALGLSW